MEFLKDTDLIKLYIVPYTEQLFSHHTFAVKTSSSIMSKPRRDRELSQVDILRRELERVQLQNAELYRFQQLYQQQIYTQQFQQSQQLAVNPTIVVQCPSTNTYHNPQYINIFLGGGICDENWQGNLIDKLRGQAVCIYNPRRDDWKIVEKQNSQTTKKMIVIHQIAHRNSAGNSNISTKAMVLFSGSLGEMKRRMLLLIYS